MKSTLMPRRGLLYAASAAALAVALSAQPASAVQSVARKWNERLLAAIRVDFARPPVHARNLFHTAVALYDAWAAYDDLAETFLLGKTVHGYTVPFTGVPTPVDVQAAREEAMSFAAYRLLKHRFKDTPGAAKSIPPMDTLFATLGYDSLNTSTDYASGDPAALGNYLAQSIIDFGYQDGSNELGDYAYLHYEPVNPPLLPELPGDSVIVNPNRWQPLGFDLFIDQAGNPVPNVVPKFVGPEWGEVVPFSLTNDDLTIYNRDGYDYWVYHDPGAPPPLTPLSSLTAEYQWTHTFVALWSSQLDPTDGVLWDISPASIGNNTSYPTTLEELPDFYDLWNGGDHGVGHALNPVTGLPYAPQIVPRGDYTRALAEFWADGPNSETPPGHWFVILNYVHDHPLFQKRFRGQGPVLDDLEWDVKAYLAMGGAMHDAAIASWGIKGWYDYVRPISAIRCMSDLGQSSDPKLPRYNAFGIPLHPGYIEMVQLGDTLFFGDSMFVADSSHVNKIKMRGWRGPEAVDDPETDVAGVGWILCENWWPYQRPTFVTPPFAGYVSGHSTYSRAAAEVMTLLTGDEFFPGGMGEFHCPQNEFLVFEDGPSVDMTLQWATYRDASDQCSLSRIWGGIHPPVDDMPGRHIGAKVGPEAFHLAERYFRGLPTSVEDPLPVARGVRNAPNPFGPTTTIHYAIPTEADVEIVVHDVMGRIVAKLVSDHRRPGVYQTQWNARNSVGQQVDSGTYFVRMTARATATGEQVVQTGKMTLIR